MVRKEEFVCQILIIEVGLHVSVIDVINHIT